jgi:hypothetical protein
MSTPELPHLEPVREDGVRAIQIGLGLWLVAGLVLLLQRDLLADRGTQWWVAVCGAGFLVGIVHLAIFSRRRVLIRARERGGVVAPGSAGLSAEGPSIAGPTAAGPTSAGPTAAGPTS